MEQVTIDEDSPLKVRVRLQNVPYREFIVEAHNSETGEIIAGAKFIVRDENGKVINEFTSTNEAMVIKNIYYGSYTIEEVEAPNHYHKKDDMKSIVISNQSDLSIRFIFDNDPLRSLKVKKLDSETLDVINGAKFKLTDKNNNSKGELNNNVSQLDDLYYGTYYLEELEAPNGYDRNPDKIKVEVTEESPLVVEIEVRDNPLRKLSIAKINSETNRYERSYNGKKHKDYLSNKVFDTKNIIIAFVKIGKVKDYKDAAGTNYLDMSVTGSGDGWYITNGYARKIKWNKKTKTDKTVYNYTDGTEVSINDGNTYVNFFNKSKSVTIK